MRAYELAGPGLETLRLVDKALPSAAAGQVVVRMRAVSLNYRDLVIARDRSGRFAPRRPLVPLSDGAGEVVEVGPDVTAVAIGDRVVGSFFQKWVDGPFDSVPAPAALGGAVDGVLSEYVRFEADATVKLPETMSFEAAATLPCAALTAWVALTAHGTFHPGQKLLAMGTGGVSVFALQFAKALGGEVILTSSSDEKLQRGRLLGADHLINYRANTDWAARARELTGGTGVDHLIEVGGAASVETSIQTVRDGGSLSVVGLLTGAPADRQTVEQLAARRNIRVHAFFVGSARQLSALVRAMSDGAVQPVVDRVFEFEKALDAYQYLAEARHVGKILIKL